MAFRWKGPCCQDAEEEQEAEEAVGAAHSLPGAKRTEAEGMTMAQLKVGPPPPPPPPPPSTTPQIDRIELVLLKPPWGERSRHH